MLSLLAFKLFSGFMVGLTLALIGDQIIDYGWFCFMLIVFTAMGLLFKIMRPWSFMNTVIFDLICVLIGLVLRMYILIAPG